MDISLEGLEGLTIPRAFTKSILLESDRTGGTAVSVSFVIKEFETNGLGFSFSESDLSRIKFYGVLTSNETIAKNLSADGSRILNLVQLNTQHPEVAVTTVDGSNMSYSATNKDESYTHAGGKAAKDIVYNMRLNFPGSEPEYLALFILPYEITQQEQELGMSENPAISYSVHTSDIIIKNSKVNQSGLIFILPHRPGTTEGQVWTGGVHKHADGSWMTGTYHTNESRTLIAMEVESSKVQDFRIREKLQKLFFDRNSLHGGENFNNRAMTKLAKGVNVQNIRERKSNYISPMHFAADTNNNLNYHFSLDLLNVIKENCEFASIYSNNQELLTSAEILSFKIIRRRVQNEFVFNRLTGGGISNRVFEENQIEEVIAHGTGDTLRSVQLSPSVPGVLHYFGIDPTMKDVTTGKYQYGVSIEMLDNTKQKIVNYLYSPENGLTNMVSQLRQYLNIASLPQNYNPATNSFTNRFVDLNYEPVWQAAATRYIDLLETILGADYAIDGTTLSEFEITLQNIASPHCGNPSGVLLLIDLIQKIIKDLSTLVRNTSQNKPHSDNDGYDSAPASGASKNIFSIKTFFKEAYDSDRPNDFGLEYLSINEIPQNPDSALMRMMDYSTWEDRIKKENTKYSIEPNRSINSFGYLSPSNIKMPKQRDIMIEDTEESAKKISGALYNVLASKARKASPLNLSRNRVNVQRENFESEDVSRISDQVAALEAAATSVSALPRESKNIYNIVDSNNVALTDASALLSADSNFVKKPKVKSRVSGSSETVRNADTVFAGSNLLKKIDANDSKITNQLLEGDAFNGFAPSRDNVTRTKGTLRGMPRIPSPKSPAEAEFNKIIAEGEGMPQDIAAVAVKYGFTKKVEYLSGYKVDKNTNYTFIKEPLWLELTEQVFENARTSSQPLFCRIVEPNLSLPTFKGFEMPAYNEYFMIGAASTLLVTESAIGGIISKRVVPPRKEYFRMSEMVSSYEDFLKTPKLPAGMGLALRDVEDYDKKRTQTGTKRRFLPSLGRAAAATSTVTPNTPQPATEAPAANPTPTTISRGTTRGGGSGY
tara:strand:- start:21465 stop:24632 length:3168 start_codon:yes stop_codon:yes gene_type:complete